MSIAIRVDNVSVEKRVYVDGMSLIVTESAGTDGAIVVFIDTRFEPDASDGSPGLRVLLNDEEIYAGVAWGAIEPGPADRR